ncbi:MAG: methyltransferase [Alphaproteobacteria bacterium]
MSKEQITDSFNKAADLYDQFAFVQSQTAFLLADIVFHLTVKGEKYDLLEVGCGTGFVGQFLLPNFENAALTFSDISPKMLEKCKARLSEKHSYLLMDGEHPTVEKESYDLIISSLSFQWFDDLEKGLENLMACLRPGGALVFSIFGDESFKQWKAAHETLGIPCGMQDFPTLDSLRSQFKTGDFSEKFIRQGMMGGKDFIRSLGLIGARTPKAGYAPLTPSQLKSVFQEFEKQDEITNQILFGILRKDG